MVDRWIAAGIAWATMVSGVWASTGGEEQLTFDLPSGVYRCAYGEPLVGVERNGAEGSSIRLHYRGGMVEMTRETSSSGLPRFASTPPGLVWIDLPWKSVLLNSRTEQPLAADCTHAPEIALASLSSPLPKPSRPTKSSHEKKGPAAKGSGETKTAAKGDGASGAVAKGRGETRAVAKESGERGGTTVRERGERGEGAKKKGESEQMAWQRKN
ncbi:MAG: hypothetical protein N2557_07530 [Hydrogenophilus sp.]|nr:hypothetical protein [Hydrogenophilus sp.]